MNSITLMTITLIIGIILVLEYINTRNSQNFSVSATDGSFNENNECNGNYDPRIQIPEDEAQVPSIPYKNLLTEEDCIVSNINRRFGEDLKISISPYTNSKGYSDILNRDSYVLDDYCNPVCSNSGSKFC